jgi:Ca2+-binding RTX toxin-like protein
MRLLSSLLLSIACLLGGVVPPAPAQAQGAPLEVTEFVASPLSSPQPYGTEQAGGNPDIALFWRFCGPGDPIQSIVPSPDTTLGEWLVTTDGPHTMRQPTTVVKIRGVRSAPGQEANGLWFGNPAVGAPTQFYLISRIAPAYMEDLVAPGAHAQISSDGVPLYGCNAQQSQSQLAEFKLELPPGFLGNPTALEACPTFLFIAAACPPGSILGHSVTETLIEGTSRFLRPARISTPVFNVQTLGLEPARLSTHQLPSEPAGPFPIKIDLRTDDDYGIDSALIDIPKNLGGPNAVITQIETVLCAQVPCAPTDPQNAGSVEPLDPATSRPFFRNPTSCKPATATLIARSWAPGGTSVSAESTFTPDNCEGVPFDPAVTVAPTDTSDAGARSGYRVSVEYPEYADDPIWRASVRGMDIAFPEGIALAPNVGADLHSCTLERFGVNAAHRQVNRLPHKCPDGSRIGQLQVTSPALNLPLTGEMFFGPAAGPGRPTAASPWTIFLLVEGAGLRIKLAGDLTISESGEPRITFTELPELPFTRLDLTTLGGPDAVLRNPLTCGTHEGSAELNGWNGKTSTSTPAVTTTGCTASVPLDSGSGGESPRHQTGRFNGSAVTEPFPNPSVIALGTSTVQLRTVDYAGVPVQQIFVQGDAVANSVTVDLAGDTYTVTDTTGVVAGPGCTTAGATAATCSAAGILEVVIDAGAGNDTVRGGPAEDTILGGAGADNLHGGPSGSDVILGGDGNDIINSGGGGIPILDDGTCGDRPIDTDEPRLTWCSDFVDAQGGFDTITYADRTGAVKVDRRPGRTSTDDDATSDGLESTERIIGGSGDDELVGGIGPDTLDGGPGSDYLCGGLGRDRVDYSSKSESVTVTLDGALPTDPDVLFEGVVGLGARQDCRLTIKQPPNGGVFHGFPCTSQPNAHVRFASCRVPGSDPPQPPPTTYDCQPNDGVEGENDCVGEDVEDIIGSPGDDLLFGNDPDPLYGQGPRVEPQGMNTLSGGGGDDLLDGGLGADVYEGGEGFDAVSYETRTEDVQASVDGAANDGSALDVNPKSNDSDQIEPDVEDLIGGAGDDTLRGSNASNVLLGGHGADFINGGGGADQLSGDEGPDRLEGGAGDDRLDGGADDDSLEGWDGHDTFSGGTGTDAGDYSEAKQPIHVNLSLTVPQLTVGAGTDTLVSVEDLRGSPQGDNLTGNDDPNRIDSGAGDDHIVVRGGGADAVTCGAGIDLADTDTSDQRATDCELRGRPETTIVGGPPVLTNDATPSFTFSSDKPGVTFVCRIDAGEEFECPANFTVEQALADGPHVLTVAAVDVDGKRDETPASRSFDVDATPPDTSLEPYPASTSDTTPTFNFSSEPEMIFECTLDGVPLPNCTSPLTVPSPLTDGDHSFVVGAVDAAGNEDPTPAAAQFKVDTVAPTSQGSLPAFTNMTQLAVAYSAADPAGSGVASVEIWVKPVGGSVFGLAATDTTPGTPQITITLGVDGVYDVYTRARDAAGNYETAPSTADAATVRDTVKPASSAVAPGLIDTNSFTVNYLATDSGAAGVEAVELWVNAPGTTGYGQVAVDSSLDTPSFDFVANSGNGTYRFYTRARDRAGNYEDSPSSPPDAATAVAQAATVPGPGSGTPAGAAVAPVVPQTVHPASPKVRGGNATAKVRVNRTGSIRLRGYAVDCPAGGPGCAISTSLKRKGVMLGRSRYKIAAGTNASVRVKLTSKGRRAIRRARRIRGVLTVTATKGVARTTKTIVVLVRGSRRT